MISEKVRPHHLERKAILYVRQSSAHQVLHNRESGALQYAMRDRLTALGWSQVEVIDDDLGRSAAGSVQRAGFERMVAEVCLGKVGAVSLAARMHRQLYHRGRTRAIHLARQEAHGLVNLDFLPEFLLVARRNLSDQQRVVPGHRSRPLRQLTAIEAAVIFMHAVAVVIEQQGMGHRSLPQPEHLALLGAEPIRSRILREVARRRTSVVLSALGVAVQSLHGAFRSGSRTRDGLTCTFPGVPDTGFRNFLLFTRTIGGSVSERSRYEAVGLEHFSLSAANCPAT